MVNASGWSRKQRGEGAADHRHVYGDIFDKMLMRADRFWRGDHRAGSGNVRVIYSQWFIAYLRGLITYLLLLAPILGYTLRKNSVSKE